MLSATGDDLKLELHRRDSSVSVALDYRVTNLQKRPIFLFNVLHEEMSEAGTYPLFSGAYVEIEEGAVVASRKLFPIPEMMFVEARNIPFVTRLLPGDTFGETVTLDLPLRPNNPYSETDRLHPYELQHRPLIFEIGYFVGADGTEKLGRSFPTDRGQSMGFDAFTEGAQKLQRVGPNGTVPVAVPAGSGLGKWEEPTGGQLAGFSHSPGANA